MKANAENEDVGILTERARELTKRAKEAAQGTDEYVHQNPWVAIGAGVAVGVIVGLLIGRGTRS
jgi:ElaB/YqjD/DUF883 family membrane-anchored ribosome-binding protein